MGIVVLANREITQEKQRLTGSLLNREQASTWLVVGGFASFIAYLKPFGMGHLSSPYVWAFWMCICFCGYGVFSFVIALGKKRLPTLLPAKLDGQTWIVLAISAFFASLFMAFIAPLVIGVFFNAFDNYWQAVVPSFVTSVFVGGILTVANATKSFLKQQRHVIQEQQQILASQSEERQKQPSKLAEPLLNKLPIEKRGVLLCLEMDDHYLKVHTDKGSHLILMRFKDAIDILEGYPGSRVHRSWWVAHDAIASSKKEGRKLILTLVNGIEAPVSKTYEDAVKTVG